MSEKNEFESDAFFFSSKQEKNDIKEVLAPHPYADYYNMNHPKRGVAVIFNQVNFSIENCPTRQGSNKDRDDLEFLFKSYKFDVLIHNDLTVAETRSVLNIISKMDHSDSDCLVIVVMSHGDDGIIYAKNNFYATKELWEPFTGKNCPSLAGKPKLFFIQACRGTGFDKGILLTTNEFDEVDSSVNRNQFYTIPNMADILVMYSTTEGYYSWRDPEKGAIFIQALVEQMINLGDKMDLLRILTIVNRQVAVEFTSYEPENPALDGNKQMCTIVSRLIRTVQFNRQ